VKHVVIVAVVLLGSSQSVRAAAQSRVVVGTVRQAWTDRPIANAEVSVIGEDGWVCTNDRGEYWLPARTGAISVIARYGESLGRPRILAASDTVAALEVNPRLTLPSPQKNQTGGFWVIAGTPDDLMAAPEIEIANGHYYVAGVELTLRPSHCGVSAPSRRGIGES
jgi:hypothetical protein